MWVYTIYIGLNRACDSGNKTIQFERNERAMQDSVLDVCESNAKALCKKTNSEDGKLLNETTSANE